MIQTAQVVIIHKLEILFFLLTTLVYGYNIGNHFNTSNHTFTCPLTGRYLVLLSVNVIGDNIVYIYKNGSALILVVSIDQIQMVFGNTAEVCGVIDCSANDTIKAP